MIWRFVVNHQAEHADWYNLLVWRKFHLLTPMQVFIVASLCAAVLAVPCAIASISHDDLAVFRDLLWPHHLNPFITFGMGFIAFTPLLLGYYHFGRIGAVLSTVIAAATWYAAGWWAILAFLPRRTNFGLLMFGLGCLLAYVFLFWMHHKAGHAPSTEQAQRALRLLPRRVDE